MSVGESFNCSSEQKLGGKEGQIKLDCFSGSSSESLFGNYCTVTETGKTKLKVKSLVFNELLI